MLTVVPEISVKATVKTNPRPTSRNRSKAIPKEIYIQYEGKEINQADLIEKFKLEWCKKYKINEINDLKVYFNVKDKKAYFVANKSVTLSIDLATL